MKAALRLALLLLYLSRMKQNHSLSLQKIVLSACSIVALAGCSEVSFSPASDSFGPTNNVEDRRPTITYQFTDVFFVSEEEGQLDLLIVVDNSASMAAEQLKMGERIETLLGHFSHVNWQLGITTTDLSGGPHSSNGHLLPMVGLDQKQVLTKNDPNYLDVFLDTVVQEESQCIELGTACGSGIEEPLHASILAMEHSNGVNRDLFREQADTAIIILSDEDERSIGDASATQPYEVISSFQQIWGHTQKKLSVSAIIVKPGDAACSDAGFPGALIADLVQQTNGVLGSICDNDYGNNLSEIANRVDSILHSMELSESPNTDELIVSFEPKAEAVDWEIKGRLVQFKQRPKKGTKVTVRYNKKK